MLTSKLRRMVDRFAVVVVSGLLLMAADVGAYVSSTAFWIKMALVVALIINGALLIRTGNRIAARGSRAVRRMRIVSMASLALWFATTLLGAVLPNVL